MTGECQTIDQAPCRCGCGKAVRQAKLGANVRRFASAACRHRFQTLARRLGEALLEAGVYTVEGARTYLDGGNPANPSRATPGGEK